MSSYNFDSPLPDGALEILKQEGHPRYLAPGEALFQVGDQGDELYIVEQGGIELLFEGGKASKQLNKGDVFGELAFFIGGQTRTATAISSGETELLELDQNAFDALMRGNPPIFFNILRHACGYLLQSEQGLIDNLKLRNRELEQALDFLRRTKQELTQDDTEYFIDPLTGLYNRRLLFTQLEQLLHAPQARAGVLIMDLDNLAPLYQQLGETFGDSILQLSAELIRGQAHQSDLPCTLGGNQLALILTQADPERLSLICSALRQGIGDFNRQFSNEKLHVNISIGAASRQAEENADSLFQRSQDYLYRCKDKGGNCHNIDGKSVTDKG